MQTYRTVLVIQKQRDGRRKKEAKCSAFIVTVIVIRKQEAVEQKKKVIVTVIVVCCVFQNSCMEIRKLKEMEYEILTSSIRGWEGEVSFEAAVSTAIHSFLRWFACVCLLCSGYTASCVTVRQNSCQSLLFCSDVIGTRERYFTAQSWQIVFHGTLDNTFNFLKETNIFGRL